MEPIEVMEFENRCAKHAHEFRERRLRHLSYEWTPELMADMLEAQGKSGWAESVRYHGITWQDLLLKRKTYLIGLDCERWLRDAMIRPLAHEMHLSSPGHDAIWCWLRAENKLIAMTHNLVRP